MKNTFIGIFLLAAIAVAYTQIPWQWRRYKDIENGNTLIQHLETYRRQNNRLPEPHEEALLIQIGFHKNKQGWQPNYQKTGSNGYLIIYKDGFTPPYLQYRSDTDKPEWALAE